MKHLATAAPRPPAVSIGGTLDLPLTTNDVTASTFHVPAQNTSPKLWSFPLKIAPSHPSAPPALPTWPHAHSPRLSYIPLQPCLQRWATINFPPSKHSPAFSPTSLKLPHSSCYHGTAPHTCCCLPTRLSCTFYEGAQTYPNCISSKGDNCTHNK